MFSSRRLAKRSIIGTRVCCPRQDGRYYPGMIKATDNSPTGEDWYTVRFEDGHSANFFEKDIIGPGFQNIVIAKLVEGQKVYLTHNGREVRGIVNKHDNFTDDVTVSIQHPAVGNRTLEVTRPLEDCRLVASRKSARLQDQDTDYSRLADLHSSENKKRTVSHVIDVPIPAAKFSRRRRSSSESDEAMVTEDKDEEMDTMDEHMAAMVLTSLSCSPVSPNFPTGFPQDRGSPGIASSFGSSGVSVMKSEPSTPSPPQVLNHSAPSGQLFGTPPIDEGIGLDDTHAYFMEDSKKHQSTKTVYKCTWPGCSKILNFVDTIEKHVRDCHLEPKDLETDSDLSDHEEEFYYTEIEVSVDTVTDTFAEMHTSSPPSPVMAGAHSIPDHDYQKKDNRTLPQSIPIRRPNQDHQYGGSFPLQSDNNHSNFSRSWQFSSLSPPVKMTKFTGVQRSGMSASPKSSPMHKKSRAEVKKCRKVYGMENRDLWCTQCKWKKACSRFNE